MAGDLKHKAFIEYVSTAGLDPLDQNELRFDPYSRGEMVVQETEKKLAGTVVRYERQGLARYEPDAE